MDSTSTARQLGKQKAMMLTALLLLLPSAKAAVSCYRAGSVTKAEYPFCRMMTSDNFALMWKTVDNTITFAVDMDGLVGWLSLGWSEAGRKGVDTGVLIRGTSAGWFHHSCHS